MKVYKRRKLEGMKSPEPCWAEVGTPQSQPLSELLAMTAGSCKGNRRPLRLHLCGSLERMTREWMREPLAEGWKLAREFVFKHRTAVYFRPENPDREISARLVSHRESWFPGCEDMNTAIQAWRALAEEWESTGLPLLSSPAATGRALLWETLPRDTEFPALSDDLARLIRSISPQHRIEVLQQYLIDMSKEGVEPADCIQYDGRLMYPALCGLDRLPIGEPRRVGYFKPYEPGWHHVAIRIPGSWNHIGLMPYLHDDGWKYPATPGATFVTWASEPELTLALSKGWEIVEHYDGYAFDKGRPLANWSGGLIEMRGRFKNAADDLWTQKAPPTMTAPKNHYDFAAAAIRQMLNATIGAMHKNEYERETFVSDADFRQWRRDHPDLAEGVHRAPTRVDGGYMVPCFVPDTSRLSIFMPHWSAQIYALARARVASWALLCDPATLVKIQGDAIYSTVEQSELDKLDTGRVGQPRRKV